jgi:hypothetical protein
MDSDRFDRLAKTLAAAGTRRGLVRLLAALPLGVTLTSILRDGPDATAEDDDHGSSHRRHRRKAKHRHQTGNDKEQRKGKRKGKRKGCTPKPDAKTCAGKCAIVTNNCGTPVDCGSCVCSPACPVCQTCDPATGQCVPIANRTVCAGSGATTSICCNGSCWDGCCGDGGAPGGCRVFLTSSIHTGALGGLDGADDICGDRAGEASLPGTFKAWLSTVGVGGESPSTRFRQSQQPYRLVNGTQVAANWADLLSPPIDAKINVTETGFTFPDGSLQDTWTNTLANGTPGGQGAASHCENWTTTAGLGNIGQSDTTTSQWTRYAESPCNVAEFAGAGRRLYCFQQD